MSGYNKGDAYEEEIFQICANKKIIKPGSNRAGAGSAADLVILKKGNEINIEVKYKSADWGQKYLDYRDEGGWFWENPDKVTELYDAIGLISHIPIFRPRNINHNNLKNWKKIRKEIIGQKDKDFDLSSFKKDSISCENKILFQYYKQKNCFYLQLKNFGLFHLSEDRFNLGTPQFDGEMIIRLRAKPFHAHAYYIDEKQIKTKTRYLDLKQRGEGSSFKIIETPWDYGFQAVLKLKKAPSKSKYNLDNPNNIFFLS